ncbi:MAG: hypothetical protein ACE5GN_00775 [Waddliaceae bacterium]
MKKLFFAISALMLMGYVGAKEECDIDESSCEEADFCPAEEENQEKCSQCPHRQYHNYYDYEDRDIDATWPGKHENSFMEDLMR